MPELMGYSPKISSNFLTPETILDKELCEALSRPQEKAHFVKVDRNSAKNNLSH